nr:hypothetical protein GCM10020093_013010 [Planobispora longispora]
MARRAGAHGRSGLRGQILDQPPGLVDPPVEEQDAHRLRHEAPAFRRGVAEVRGVEQMIGRAGPVTGGRLGPGVLGELGGERRVGPVGGADPVPQAVEAVLGELGDPPVQADPPGGAQVLVDGGADQGWGRRSPACPPRAAR